MTEDMTNVDPEIENLENLGSKVTEWASPDDAVLEVIPNMTGNNQFWAVTHRTREFGSLCKMTAQPDSAIMSICIVPDSCWVESKCLKMYLNSFRNHRTFMEPCVNRIARELFNVMQPYGIRVHAHFLPRGGITIDPDVVLIRPGGSPREEEEIRNLLELRG